MESEMMTHIESRCEEDKDAELWQRLVHAMALSDEAYNAYQKAMQIFLERSEKPIEKIRQVLEKGGGNLSDIRTVLIMLAQMRDPACMDLVPLFFWYALRIKLNPYVKDVLHSFGQDWVKKNLGKCVSKILEKGDDTDYSLMIRFCEDFDPALSVRLAKKAAASPDAAIRECGESSIESFIESCNIMKEALS
jgi:hypothetical protein